MVRYVIIPSDLARELHEPLRRHYGDDPSVRVIVERRAPDDLPGPRAGRRTGDRGPSRRLTISASAPGALPPEAAPHAHRLRFLRLIEPDAPDLADRDSLRLVARFQHGDPDAFDALYRRHYDGVYGYLRMSLRDSHLAEDVAQHVFVRALGALPRYRFQPGVPFWSWLREIARNEARRALRSRGIAVESHDPAQMEQTKAAAATWQSERAVVALGEQLPARQQQVFILRYGVGLSIAETAAVMSVTQDAVKGLSKRALAQVRQEVRAEEPPPPEPPRRRLPMLARLRFSPVLRCRRTAL
ncbi:MAG TPA: sigma-70 family RNA polymerase sigma factor [Solirubrobacteraceae bacterium]|nr:sigma-70 family RNA polymerase sigma factor [Solirubrobacteraceae bacterium]